jgi:hypothetical protein
MNFMAHSKQKAGEPKPFGMAPRLFRPVFAADSMENYLQQPNA